MDLWNGWQIIKKRKWLILVISALSFGLMSLFSRLAVSRYASTAKLIVTPHTTVVTTPDAAYSRSDWASNYDVLSQLITSQDFLQRVATTLRMKESWDQLTNQIKVDRVGDNNWSGTTVILLTTTSEDPLQAKVLAQTVSDEFVHYVPEFAAREYTSNRKFLEGLVAESREKLVQGEASIKKWQEKHHSLDITSAASDYISSMSKLRQERMDSAQKVADIRRRVADLQEFVQNQRDVPPWVVMDQKNEHIPMLQQNLSTERFKLSQMEQTYKAGEPLLETQRAEVKTLESQLDTELKTAAQSLLADREADLQGATAKLDEVERSLKGMKDTWALAENNLEYNHLTRQIATWSKNYDELLGQLYQARVNEQNAKREGSISVLEQPTTALPMQSAGLRLREAIPLLIPVCICLAIGVAFVVETVSSGLKVSERIEECLGLPVMGTIPKLPRQLQSQWNQII